MKTKGKIVEWNDDRGFGFVVSREGGRRAFLHISEFRGSSRPCTGLEVVYSEVVGERGLKAVAADYSLKRRNMPKSSRRVGRQTWRTGGLLILMAILLLLWIAKLSRESENPSASRLNFSSWDEISVPSSHVATETAYSCDGRTRCTQMHSCAEAKFFITHCPGTQMDGDNDGVPCEDQWCSR